MRVFLTGGTGYIGSAVLDALVRAGHQVTALVRDPEKAERLDARGAGPLLGDLGTPDRYLTAAVGHDAVVHTALAEGPRGPDLERAFLDAILPALAAADGPRRFVHTSSVWVLGTRTTAADEAVTPTPIPYSTWRLAHEAQVVAAAGPTLSTAVVRPGIVYGSGRGLVSDMLRDALNGLVRVIGDGTNRWACVYDRDLAELYLRVLTAPDASGIYHGAGEEDERVTDIAEAITRHVSPVADIRHVPLPEARGKLGPFAEGLALDQIVRSPRARALGWTPTMHGITGNAARLFEEYRRAARE
ncbi:MAG: NAD-dependent epimerase/dehydratase family protein [Vicinamibacterales bacterium]